MKEKPLENITDTPVLDYQSIFEKGPGLCCILKPDSPAYTIVSVSDAFLQATLTKRSEIIGRSFFDVFPENSGSKNSGNRKNLRQLFENLLFTKKPNHLRAFRYDIPAKSKGNFVNRYWTVSNTPVLNAEGEVEYIINCPTDVTDVIKSAHDERLALNIAEGQRSQLYNLFMQAPVAIGIFKGPDYLIELANPFLCRLYGKEEHELFAKPLFEVISGTLETGIKEILDEVVITGQSYVGIEMPVPLMRQNGLETIYCNFVYEPLHEPDGSISGVIAVATDVTEQVHSRLQLQDSQNRLSMALDASRLGVWDLDVKSDTISTNLHYAQIFGMPEGIPVWTSKMIYDYILEEDRPDFQKATDAALLDTGKLNIQLRIQWPDRSIHWIHCIGTVYYNDKREPLRMLGTVQDITVRKEQEQHKDEFISVVSHELKTPVTSLNAFCQVLQRKFGQSGNTLAAEMLGKMKMQINRLNLVIHDLLDVTRIEGNKIQFRHSMFTFEELVNEVVEEVQRITETHSINVECAGSIMLNGDKERIGQVLTNLLINAVKYSPGKDKVQLTVKCREDEVVCMVKDFGIGIPEDKQQYIFERFSRVQSNHMVSGLGLGLYISAEIIKRQNGRIWMESTPGAGSSFYFALPVTAN